MNEVAPIGLVIAALLVAVYIFRRLEKARAGAAGGVPTNKPPPGLNPGTLALGQYAVRPSAQWLVLTPGVS